MTKIQINHMAPVVVGTTEIKLPFFFTSGNWTKSYCCITEDLRLIDVHYSSIYTNIDVKRYDDAEDISTRLEIEMRESYMSLLKRQSSCITLALPIAKCFIQLILIQNQYNEKEKSTQWTNSKDGGQ